MPISTKTRTKVSTKTVVAAAILAVVAAVAGLLVRQVGTQVESKLSPSEFNLPSIDATDYPKFVSHQVVVEVNDAKDVPTLQDPANTDSVIQSVYTQFGQPKITSVFHQPTNGVSQAAHVQQIETKFAQRTKRGDATVTQHLDNFYLLTFADAVSDNDLAQMITQLTQSEHIASVSHNSVLHVTTVPNDPYFASLGSWGQEYKDLWGLKKIAAPGVWSSGIHGSSSIIIGVVDTGVDATHPDLVDNMYTNTGEIAGNATDDDGNGYVDDVAGWDFVNGDNNPDDDYFHGTHVAGTIAATGNNAIGVTGVMWDAQILPVKVLSGADGSGLLTDVASGIVYATDQGADVINLSLGGTDDSSALEAAVQYAHSLGTVVVAAAGNDSEDAMNFFPASYDEVITVAASSPTDTLSSFSNFGAKVDVTAPGENILSLLATHGTAAPASDIVGTNYLRLNGTSMATPHVTGAVGLLLQYDPALSVEDIRQDIRQADDIAEPGWDNTTGYGRLNVAKAVTTSWAECGALITDPDNNGEITSTVTISGYAAGVDFKRYIVKIFEVDGTTTTQKVSGSYIRGPVTAGALDTLTIPDFTPGTHYSIQLTVLDSSGRLCASDRKEVVGSYVVGSYADSGSVNSVVRVDNYVYAADGLNGLQILDISTPSSPTLVGTYDTPGSALGVTVEGNYAYVADYMAGLQILDISTPSSPTLVGTYDTPGTAYGVTIAGNYAYVADVTSGLQILDISTPSSPVLVGTYSASIAQAVSIVGSYAYIAGGPYGLQIIDVSTPASPVLVGSYDDGSYAEGVTVEGNYAYVADFLGGFEVVNIANPVFPYLLSTYSTLGSSYVYNVIVQDDIAVVAAGPTGVQIVSLTQPLPAHLAVLSGQYNTPGHVLGVDIDGHYAYVGDGTAGFEVLDISVSSTPTLVGSYYSSGETRDIVVSGSYAYLAKGGEGLEILDVSILTNPTFVASYRTGNTIGVAAVGNYVYLADDIWGLEILDVSTPTHPVLIGRYDTAGHAYDVSVSGNYAYVADEITGLLIIDVSTPASPTLVGNYDTAYYAEGVFVSGNYAYVADVSDGLDIVDVSTPSTPTLVGNYDTPGTAYGVTVEGNYAYIADYGSLQILDISTPSHPTLAATYDVSAYTFGAAVNATTAYVTDGSDGLLVVELVTP